MGSKVIFLTNQNVAVKRIFGFDIQIDKIAPANIFFIDAQNFYPGFDDASRRQDEVDHIRGTCLESLIFKCQSTGADFHDFQGIPFQIKKQRVFRIGCDSVGLARFLRRC